jgi:hypothetical protein
MRCANSSFSTDEKAPLSAFLHHDAENLSYRENSAQNPNMAAASSSNKTPKNIL